MEVRLFTNNSGRPRFVVSACNEAERFALGEFVREYYHKGRLTLNACYLCGTGYTSFNLDILEREIMESKRILHALYPIRTKMGEIGSTARRGTKWANLSHGEKIALCYCPNRDDHELVGEGEVVETWIGTFKTLPARLLENNDEKEFKYQELLASMQVAYGDFQEHEIVTVVVYKRLS